jgi:hypothetical protein
MGKLPLIAAVASAMWALPASAEGGRGNDIPSKPEVALAQLETCASDLTAVNETKSTASVAIPIASMTIGATFTGKLALLRRWNLSRCDVPRTAGRRGRCQACAPLRLIATCLVTLTDAEAGCVRQYPLQARPADTERRWRSLSR